MKTLFRNTLSCLCALALSLTAVAAETIDTCVTSITTAGALVLAVEPLDLFRAGYEPGDVVDVDICGEKLQLPYCKGYSEVLIGESLLYESSGSVFISTNYGHFAGEHNLAEWDGEYWQLPEEKSEENSQESSKKSSKKDAEDDSEEDPNPFKSLTVKITLAQKGGYSAMREKLRLKSSNQRGDYITDEEYSNFRAVAGGRLGHNVLYRSSTPASITRLRAVFADHLVEKAGVKTVLNMANAESRLKKVMDTPRKVIPYYRSLFNAGAVIARALPADLAEERFRDGLAEELRFLISREGPYLVHCFEGKDRTGYVCYLLGSLMGLTPQELKDDYGASFTNFYWLRPGSEVYEILVNDGLAYFLRTMRGAQADAPLPDLARGYLRSIGLSEREISKLEDRLSTDY